MTHNLTFLPILLPILAGVILLMPPFGSNLSTRRVASVVLSVFTFAVSLALLLKVQAEGTQVYAIGDWSAPFGIVLVADPLSTLLVCLTTLLGVVCVLYASAGDDDKGSFFHPLVHFLILGVNGAFLTGDAFNLFVFFEVLLIASYSLLMHGGDKKNTRAALQYVILNLVGSAIFLIALGVLYGVLGTLNMADMAQKVALLQGDDVYLAKIGGMLLLVVFALKGALLPLHLWLPNTYATAMPVVAALFAIMTKVGVYSMMRVYTLIFGDEAGELTHMAQSWLWWLAIATIAMGAVGVLASKDLRKLTANLVIVSVGTLVALVAVQTIEASSAAIYYLVHSTLVTAALFILADLIGRQRGEVADRISAGSAVSQPKLLGACFLIAAIAVIGMPPLSGFIGKVWLLKATLNAEYTLVFWPIYLFASLAILFAVSKAGSTLFWYHHAKITTDTRQQRVHPAQLVALLILISGAPLMTVFAGPLSEYAIDAATQLHDFNNNIKLILSGGQ
ncbi:MULTISPECIES: monovalent cation/H+ antiporter subunit D [unclassified Colwellia]|uniref:monovalent cation/H+ antiporter subunit D n=1 Tax=unclassified Colwellia TaxID=196834 RepID=UPI0015F4620E|nr:MULTISPECIES: monovalent cation/H+ antiporter subunit D [unclassified Colwellia]MBA6231778.1 monovalent cation/H+ antiporter subunit D [Colwellia sp. MB02u-7]MBA6235733.1 monovalent cation/H+ antiporter subunit D [Colwellia sp. MB02u-11]MBA6255038.1 monovalent cation/H+ antiporter subunit D [Colwellia sp. MB3u-28]MBA6259011.1 monovalent cation/H+ antiporter subunit D [Colwellia sp. MB3u-41]MBA6298822.1 monovalent cation/H+ antiporter subunit D [Colwellia sp. MB3u-22]